MNWRSITAAGLAAVLTAGCDKIPFLGGKGDTAAEDTTAVAEAQAADAGAAAQPTPAGPEAAPPPAQAETAPPPPRETAPPPAARQVVPAQAVAGEEPWTPTLTGTVRPGMSSEEVIATWGEPVVERAIGVWTYLYFRNGCERRCGTFDLVLLENDQVVDAIVRGQGHTYAGVSSSPATATPAFTPPTGATPPDTTGVIG